jgi:3-oxoadipate enol-lactonase
MPRERVGEVELYYELCGEGDETVAFVNGVAMTAQSWAPIKEVFQEEFRCVLHDTRGQLMSEKPEMDYTLEMHAEDMKNLFDHLGIEEVHLIGTSYGSEIAMIFACEHPEMVKTLLVVTGASELDGAEPFFRALVPWAYSSDYIEANSSALDERERILSTLPRDFFEGFIRLVKAFHRLDVTDQLQRIECPTLVVSAENDIVKPPRFGRIIHERIPGSEFVIMPRSGHAVVIEDPIGLSEVMLSFIKRHR